MLGQNLINVLFVMKNSNGKAVSTNIKKLCMIRWKMGNVQSLDLLKSERNIMVHKFDKKNGNIGFISFFESDETNNF